MPDAEDIDHKDKRTHYSSVTCDAGTLKKLDERQLNEVFKFLKDQRTGAFVSQNFRRIAAAVTSVAVTIL